MCQSPTEGQVGGMVLLWNNALVMVENVATSLLQIMRYTAWSSCSCYTWTNKRKKYHTISERLDRVMANYEWLNLFPESHVRHLPRIYFDHCPLLLSLDSYYHRGNKIFRLETICTSDPSFQHLVNDVWSQECNLLHATTSFVDAVKI
ncbi:uncharacterized protein LOC132043376 [Lycium ferocissimum]|uniref:uncharacterized protein LOC132043376 n=1 Tax=Lycium ferocissimum TaxID=112874 RepID=UPI002814F23C|nr:uncharacterized protein LOC132043376 [Lycium ferocissimum]